MVSDNQETAVLDCGHAPTPSSGPGSGYGIGSDGKRYCYACCAVRDVESMRADGVAVLYLTRKSQPEQLPGPAMARGMVTRWTVSNWPGSLSFPAYGVREKRRGGGFGAQRTDAYFHGPDGYIWHAVNRGDNDIARCRRTRQRIKAPS